MVAPPSFPYHAILPAITATSEHKRPTIAPHGTRIKAAIDGLLYQMTLNLGSQYDVAHKHRAGHGANAAGNRRNGTGH